MIDLQLLGTGAMMPLPDRWLSALLVRYRSELILFDCGEGTQVAMRKRSWGFRRLGNIFLTHLHADHVAGLPGLLHTVANSGRSEPIKIYGPLGTVEVVHGLLTIAREVPTPVVTELTPGDAVRLGEHLQISTVKASHRIECLGFRADLPRQRPFLPDRAKALGVPQIDWKVLQEGRHVRVGDRVVDPEQVTGDARPGIGFGFLTDSRWFEEAADFYREVELLVCEATYGDDADREKAQLYGHMTFGEAASIARDAQARSLWLTHFSPAMSNPSEFLEKAASIYPDAILGEAGLVTTLRYPELQALELASWPVTPSTGSRFAETAE